MKNVNIPEGYQQLMPYLIVENASKFIDFTRNVFGATEKFKTMRDERTIMHAEVSIGDSVIMFADATEQYLPQNAGMFLYVDDCDEIFNKAIDNGATEIMPPADQSYGRSAGIKDPFGNAWWITSV
ncbi:VOC family protein [Mucilaginibacter sp. L3T2-6]|uniref:VOC family protein n=1 Tax=Mucilaginibacter sp. L3T2-6 TaxID=3062491 RepID=UPI0026764649|nr:VOC family protein [Mucilaginibacter sp. L3T2-6]MDO3644628.1 VOC family protein [Mucilaginibacter sp. L3T2-6]MDV6217000.1 VOC family protein [Mucilaginibacter sp. L3T2-6]